MSYNLYDNNECIRIVKDGRTLFLLKNSIRSFTQIREDVIKIDTGKCLENICFRHQEVSEPITFTPVQLVSILRYWVSNLTPPGPNQ